MVLVLVLVQVLILMLMLGLSGSLDGFPRIDWAGQRSGVRAGGANRNRTSPAAAASTLPTLFAKEIDHIASL